MAVGFGDGVPGEEAIALCRELKDLAEPPTIVLYGRWADAYGATPKSRDLTFALSLADDHVLRELLAARLPPTALTPSSGGTGGPRGLEPAGTKVANGHPSRITGPADERNL